VIVPLFGGYGRAVDQERIHLDAHSLRVSVRNESIRYVLQDAPLFPPLEPPPRRGVTMIILRALQVVSRAPGREDVEDRVERGPVVSPRSSPSLLLGKKNTYRVPRVMI
jgi:hypothetical protein